MTGPPMPSTGEAAVETPGPSVAAERDRYAEVLSAAMRADEPEGDFTPEQLEALLRLLIAEGDPAEVRLAAWLRDAL